MSQLAKFNRNLISDFFDDTAASSLGYFIRPLHGSGTPTNFKVDIKESETDYLLHAELPGLQKENIQVTIDEGSVTIAAEIKQHDQQTKDEKVIHSERYYGAVSRSFQLPVTIDQAVSEAKYENGVLELKLVKKVSSNNQQLKIK
jgi:HSP20 family protein